MRLTLSFLFILLVDLAFAQIQFKEHIISEREVSNTRGLMAIDLNGDDDLDLLVASADDNKISWFENDGTGALLTQHIISTSAEDSYGVFAIDLDGDGDNDVLSAAQDDEELAWYENDGIGNFGVKHVITTLVIDPVGIISADIDGDGDNDVLSASRGDNKIAWYENDGLGNFGVQQIITTNHIMANIVLSADLDLDGDLDVISAGLLDYKITWCENLGGGVFGAQQIISTQSFITFNVQADDLDLDGDLDIIATSGADDQVVWHENNGSGIFGNEQIICDTYDDPACLKTCDLDGDGDKDIVFSCGSITPVIACAINNGLGSFSAPIDIDSSLLAYALCTADFDDDGDFDIVAGYEGYLALYKNDTLGFGSREFITYAIGAPTCVVGADLDGDGDKDVLSCSAAGHDEVTWYKNLGAGKFEYKATISYNVNSPKEVLAVDLDGDTDLDVICGSKAQRKIAWYENNGTGNFSTQQIISDSANSINSIASGDVDGDGDMDVMYGAGYNLTTAYGGNLNLWKNDGSGNFGQAILIHQIVNDGINDIHYADLDGDGDGDIIVACMELLVLTNDGSGNFSLTWSDQIAGSWCVSVASEDLDGDGHIDIVVCREDGNLFWIKNDGIGGFTSTTNSLIVNNTPDLRKIQTSDLDLDGDVDVIVGTDSYFGSIFWFENDGSGDFGSLQLIGDSVSIRSIDISDLDNDGDLDIIYAALHQDKIIAAKNLGYMSFASAQECDNQTYAFGSQTLTAPGIYIDTMQTIYGLDSVVELSFSHIPAPVVELQPFPADTVCIEEDFALLPFATPFGGFYQSNGVVGNQLDLYAAGLGMQELIYTYTDTLTGCSNSDSTAIEIVQCLLVEQIGAALNCKVYPNPTSGLLFIELPETEGEATLIQLFDGRGRALYSNTLVSKSATIQLQAYHPGIYYLKIQSGKSIEVRKVILN